MKRNSSPQIAKLQYPEALKTIGTGESTKVLPVEFTALLRPFVDHAVAASDGKD